MSLQLLRNTAYMDAAGRSRHWSMLPVSIATHVLAAAAVVIIPLAADVTLPTPASPLHDVRWVVAVPPPRLDDFSRPPTTRTQAAPRNPAPVVAPSTIAPEADRPPEMTWPAAPMLGQPIGSVDGFPSAGELPGRVIAAVPPVTSASPQGPIRPGQGIKEPRKIIRVAPIYPEMARVVRIEGTVVLEAIIDVHGQVDRVRVLRSVPLLDAAAVEAVRAWRYTPTLLNGVPVPVLLTITVQFRLQH
jgi:protein TonB